MRLVRFVILFLTPSPHNWEDFSATTGDIKLSVVAAKASEKSLPVVVSGEIPLAEIPERSETGRVVVPDGPRRDIEAAIETLANLIAVSAMVKRSISTPDPQIALIPESDDEREWLRTCSGVQPGTRGIVSGSFSVDLAFALDTLRERHDGAALLAEALSHDHAAGRFHELIRFFELAFACNYNRLPQHLGHFLVPTGKGYTSEEVANWTSQLRDRMVHAGGGEFVLESDVRSVVGRMQQAAYEVLFNKADWRSQSAQRRDVWEMPTGTTSPDSPDLFIVKGGGDIAMNLKWIDDFGAFPLALFSLMLPHPDDWWVAGPAGANRDDLDIGEG